MRQALQEPMLDMTELTYWILGKQSCQGWNGDTNLVLGSGGMMQMLTRGMISRAWRCQLRKTTRLNIFQAFILG
jgi:hypothetical protein